MGMLAEFSEAREQPQMITDETMTQPGEESQVEEAPKAEASATPTAAVAAPATSTDAEKASDVDLFEAAMQALEKGESASAQDSSYKKLSRGERLEATVIQVDRDRVFVNLGTKSEGIIPLSELSEEDPHEVIGNLRAGDKITVVVIKPEGAEGNPVVSKRKADFDDAWDRVEEAFREGHYLNATVTERVKGGLVVDVGVRGFVPGTHVGSGRLRNIDKYVGQALKLKVLDIDRERKKVVLSNRQAEEEERGKAKEEFFDTVQPGQRLSGTVRRLTEYGAFVDLGGVDGLLHISEMSWARINHPKEMFKEGDEIEVMVLRLDKANGKISLGHRQVLPDPWNLIRERYTVGQKFTTTIGRLVVSGAFIRLPEGAEAFLPMNEMTMRRIRRPDEVVSAGQEVEVQILDLRPDDRRMVLSMRAAGGAEPARTGAAPSGGFDDLDRSRDKGGKAGGKRGRKGTGGRRDEEDFDEFVGGGGRRGFATGGATIGERLGMLKGFLREDDSEEEPEAEAEAAPAESSATTESDE